jgi:hypothetical protein
LLSVWPSWFVTVGPLQMAATILLWARTMFCDARAARFRRLLDCVIVLIPRKAVFPSTIVDGPVTKSEAVAVSKAWLVNSTSLHNLLTFTRSSRIVL